MRSAPAIWSAATPIALPAIAAARAFDTLWRPTTRSSLARSSGVLRPASVSTSSPVVCAYAPLRPAREDALEHHRGRGLPLRAGHADDRRGAETEEQADLGEHRDVALQRAHDRRRARPDPGDHEHQLGIGEREVVARWAEDEL